MIIYNEFHIEINTYLSIFNIMFSKLSISEFVTLDPLNRINLNIVNLQYIIITL